MNLTLQAILASTWELLSEEVSLEEGRGFSRMKVH